MSAVAAVVLAVAAGGCGGGDDRTGPGGGSDARPAYPAWLDGEYADGTLQLRYPGSWRTGRSERLGTLLSDNRSRHPAFVSLRYLDHALPPRREAFAELAARTLRPPAGRGLTLLYTQTASLGGRTAVEATFVWQTKGDTPIGPTFRTFGVGTASGRTAFLVFAAERAPLHAGAFGWIRRSIRWDVGLRAGRSPIGRHVNDP